MLDSLFDQPKNKINKMRTRFILMLMILFSLTIGASIAQDTENENRFIIIDEPAQPAGGYSDFYGRVSRELIYPDEARRQGIEGKVYIQFVVNVEGELTEFEINQDIGAGCGEAAIEAIKKAGKWSIPRHQGKPREMRILLPITFML